MSLNYLILSDPKTSKKTQKIDNWCFSQKGLINGTLPFVCVAPAIFFSVLWLGSSILPDGKKFPDGKKHAADGFFYLPHIWMPICVVLCFLPFAWIGWRLATKKVAYVATKNTSSNWWQCFTDMAQISDELEEFVRSLPKDDFSYASAKAASETVTREVWDSLPIYQRAMPFMRVNTAKRPQAMEDVLNDELKRARRVRDQLTSIAESVMTLSIKSAPWTHSSKSHLDILTRDLETLCSSLDELSELSGHELEAAEEEPEAYPPRKAEYYSKGEFHQVTTPNPSRG